jgi:hypothetical protein
MEVNIEIEGTSKPLHKGDGPALTFLNPGTFSRSPP